MFDENMLVRITLIILLALVVIPTQASACDSSIKYDPHDYQEFIADPMSCMDAIPPETFNDYLLTEISDSGRIEEVTDEQWDSLYPGIYQMDLAQGDISYASGILKNGNVEINLFDLEPEGISIISFSDAGGQGFILRPRQHTIFVDQYGNNYLLEKEASYEITADHIIIPPNTHFTVINGIDAVTIDAGEEGVNLYYSNNRIRIEGSCSFMLSDRNIDGSILEGGYFEIASEGEGYHISGSNTGGVGFGNPQMLMEKGTQRPDRNNNHDYLLTGDFEGEIKSDNGLSNVLLGSEHGDGILTKRPYFEVSNLWGPLYVEFSGRKDCEYDSCLMIDEDDDNMDVKAKGSFKLDYIESQIYMLEGGTYRYVQNQGTVPDDPAPKRLSLNYTGFTYSFGKKRLSRSKEGVNEERAIPFERSEGNLVLEFDGTDVTAWIQDSLTGEKVNDVDINLGGNIPDSVLRFIQERRGMPPQMNNPDSTPKEVFSDIQPYINNVRDNPDISTQEKIMEIAEVTHFLMDQSGFNYAWGGEPILDRAVYEREGGMRGIDCSGYVGYVMCSAGIESFCPKGDVDITKPVTWSKAGSSGFTTVSTMRNFQAEETVYTRHSQGRLNNNILDTLQPGDVLYTNGHIMIYAGKDSKGNHYVLESTTRNRDFGGVSGTGVNLNAIDDTLMGAINLVKRFRNPNDPVREETDSDIANIHSIPEIVG